MTSQKKSKEAENRDTDFNLDSLDDGTIKHQEELIKEKHISHYKVSQKFVPLISCAITLDRNFNF